MGLVEPMGRWLDRVGLVLGSLPARLVFWLAVVSSVAIFAIFGLVLYAARVDVQRAAWTASGNLTAAVSQQIHSELTTLDMSLLDLKDSAERADIMTLAPDLRRTLLFDRVSANLGLGEMFLLDANGRVVEQAGVVRPTPLELSQHAFFSVHRDGNVGLFISHPFVSLLDGEPCIALSRRVVRAGAFVGVAAATVRLSHYKELFSSLDLGAEGMSALFSLDGTLVMRQPFIPSLTDSQVWHLPIAEVMPGPSGSTEGVSHVDGVHRQFFYHRLGNLPLVQVVGRSLDDVYAAWWLRLWLTGLALFILGNVTLVLVIAQQGELRRRHAAESELAVLATTDKLTGLANRRQFDDVLGATWRTASQDMRPMAVLMVDIDHFKGLNDAIGHLGGDAALAALGRCLALLPLPNGALAARYGGEEFAIVLPEQDVEAALACGEMVRSAITALAQAHPRSPFGVMTISVGVAATTPGAQADVNDLLAAADQALYAAKQGGRNRVEVASWYSDRQGDTVSTVRSAA